VAALFVIATRQEEIGMRTSTSVMLSRVLLTLMLLMVCEAVAVDNAACAPSGHDPHKIGIVLLHGKHTFSLTGMGNRQPPSFDAKISSLGSALRAKGYRVAMPEMPWTRDHVYDATYEEAMDRIASAVAKLKAEGAERIVVAGHSLGGNAALGYAALKGGIAGVIALAPGGDPGLRGFRARVAESVARAHAMVEAGQGNKRTSFDDVNMGYTGSVSTTAERYLSYFDPAGNAVIPRNVARLPAGTPLLWVAAEEDPLSRLGEDYAFTKAPPSPLSRYVTVPGGHQDAPKSAIAIVVAWLNCL
jgi:pimeloyl-ACP methyl ester carboxylesterase